MLPAVVTIRLFIHWHSSNQGTIRSASRGGPISELLRVLLVLATVLYTPVDSNTLRTYDFNKDV